MSVVFLFDSSKKEKEAWLTHIFDNWVLEVTKLVTFLILMHQF